MNNNPALFYGAILVAIVGLALGAFFLVPNINHVIADSNMYWKGQGTSQGGDKPDPYPIEAYLLALIYLSEHISDNLWVSSQKFSGAHGFLPLQLQAVDYQHSFSCDDLKRGFAVFFAQHHDSDRRIFLCFGYERVRRDNLYQFAAPGSVGGGPGCIGANLAR